MSAFGDITDDTKRLSGVRPPVFTGRDYWPEIQNVQAADVGTRGELVLRYIIVLGAGLALFYASMDPLFLVWVAAYLTTNIAYSVVLIRVSKPVPLRGYLMLFLMNMLTSSIYTVMPLYLWLAMTDPALKTLALCGLIGHGMFNLSRHTHRTWVAYWDTICILASIAIIGLAELLQTQGLGGQICVGFGTLALMVFYAQAQLTTILDRETLAETREEVIEAQKQSTMAQITAGVAHDFNNKLTVIQGNIELAALTHDPAERAALLREAKQAGDKAAEVVAHMQAFVRKSPLRVSHIDLADLGRDVQRAAQSYLPETMSVSLQIDDGVEDMDSDATLLRTALLNLILNARDAMDGKGGTIDLRIAPGYLANWSGKPPSAPGPYLRFDVTDEGPGLPVEAFHRVQEPFYSSKPIGMGTGLGLSMVKGFAEQIGGAMMLRNRQVGGLEVSLILPVTPQV